jgi:TRAP-type C4-dicarboxylate transport system permease small subunit
MIVQSRSLTTAITWITRFNNLMAYVSGWLILLITLISCYGVFTRYVLNDPDTWSFTVSSYLMCFVVFLAISNALQEGVHVRVDIIQEWFPGKTAHVTRVLSDIACLIFLWFFFEQVWTVFHDSLSRGRTDETTLAWPVAAIQWAMPFGVALTLLAQAILLIGNIATNNANKSA